MDCAKRTTHKRVSMRLAFPRPGMRLRSLVDHCYLRVPLEYTKDCCEGEEEFLFLLHLRYFSPYLGRRLISRSNRSYLEAEYKCEPTTYVPLRGMISR